MLKIQYCAPVSINYYCCSVRLITIQATTKGTIHTALLIFTCFFITVCRKQLPNQVGASQYNSKEQENGPGLCRVSHLVFEAGTSHFALALSPQILVLTALPQAQQALQALVEVPDSPH